MDRVVSPEDLLDSLADLLRIGMSNPPFMLEHLDAICDALLHPSVYAFLHVPLQSGSDPVLLAMNREYTVADFRTVVDTVRARVPGVRIRLASCSDARPRPATSAWYRSRSESYPHIVADLPLSSGRFCIPVTSAAAV